MIHRNLYKRLERLEASAREATVPRLVLINEGTAAGLTSVWGPDGRLVWLEPPEGYRAGEPIEDHLTKNSFVPGLSSREATRPPGPGEITREIRD
jgi:hypothetical protein